MAEKKQLGHQEETILDTSSLSDDQRRRMSADEVDHAVRSGSVPRISGEREAISIAKQGGWEVDALIRSMEQEDQNTPYKRGVFDVSFGNPRVFTWVLVAFASMGGLLSGCVCEMADVDDAVVPVPVPVVVVVVAVFVLVSDSDS